MIAAIRQVNRNHILFIEGNRWAVDIACLDHFADENYALSVHYYEPVTFTFNLVPLQTYPLKSGQSCFDKTVIRKIMGDHQLVARRFNVPVLVGEFGVNYRGGFYG